MEPRAIYGACLSFVLVACASIPSAVVPAVTSETPTPAAAASPTEATPVVPIAVPAPRIEIAGGERALFIGDYSRARLEFETAYYTTGDPEIRAAALLGLGRTEYADGNYANALVALRSLTQDYSATTSAADGYILLGKTYDALERFSEAVPAYEAYLALRPGVLDSYVLEWLGDARANSGDLFGAIGAYQAAIQAPRSGDPIHLEVSIADSYAAAGDASAALAKYSEIASAASNDYLKAQMDLLSGRVHLGLGQADQAYQFFLHAVYNYPLSYDSYSALVALVEAGVPVDDLSRGLVDYFAGQYGVALAAFNRYESANPENDGTVYYYRALTLRALGYYQDAVLDWDYLISNHPQNRYWETAWEDKADTLWYYLDDYSTAARTMLDFTEAAAGSLDEPRFLLNAGRIYERGGFLAEAAVTWESMADIYPSSNLLPLSLFWAGIAHYRLANPDAALVDFQRSLILSTRGDDQARASFWIGKMHQAKGNTDEAQTAWQQAAALDPTGYYSERARDMVYGRALFENPPAYSIFLDRDAEQAEAEAWLRVIFFLPADTDLSTPGLLYNDTRLQRGAALWNTGFYTEARLEFEDLRLDVQDDPVASYRLGNYLLELGLYRSAIFAHERALVLAGINISAGILAAPDYFLHVRYGAYYQDLVVPLAEQYGFHPLFIWSIIWRESLFEGFVYSPAGARGLMQIMPATGAVLAERVGWPLDYSSLDLYRPLVSVTYGIHNLDLERYYFGDHPFAWLAAYNAGRSGEMLAWRQLAGNDPDLFVEVVRYEETRTYIRHIYEVFAMYRSLYGAIP